MKYFGAHVSTSGGVQNAPLNAKEIGARAFALFTKNQKQWAAKPLDKNNIDKFKKNCEEFNYKPENILPHTGYLINLGNNDPLKRKKSRIAFIDEMNRCEQLGLEMLNFHPGSHLKEMTEDECLDLISDEVNMILEKTKGVKAVIENTAGMGSSVGYRFEHLAHIISRIDDKKRIGVCLDTCHTYAAGYDIKTRNAYLKTFREFEKIVGFSYLCGMHINDSKSEHGSRIDRHENLGKGTLGLEPFRWIASDRRFNNMPLILETSDHELWPEEIKMLYSFQKK